MERGEKTRMKNLPRMNQYSSEPSYLDNLALLSLVVAAAMVIAMYFEDQTPGKLQVMLDCLTIKA